MTESRLNLTGLWHGIFNYPRHMPPNSFTAELRDMGGSITGETSERSDSSEDSAPVIHAFINGRRLGAQVIFTKHYDELRRATLAVHYAGTLNARGDEIAGAWNIPGYWAGTFLMVRTKRNGSEVERKISETVR